MELYVKFKHLMWRVTVYRSQQW